MPFASHLLLASFSKLDVETLEDSSSVEVGDLSFTIDIDK
jgi:hypothetical protein